MSRGCNRDRFGRDFSLCSRLFIWNFLKLRSQTHINTMFGKCLWRHFSWLFKNSSFFPCNVFTVLQIMPNTCLLTVDRKKNGIVSETLFKTNNRKKGFEKIQLLWHKMVFVQWQQSSVILSTRFAF